MQSNKIVQVIKLDKALLEVKNGVADDIKDIINDNLQIIAALYTENSELKKASTVGAVRKMYSASNKEARNEKVSILSKVQKHLTDNMASYLVKIGQDEVSKSIIVSAIKDYVINNKIIPTDGSTQEDLIEFLIREITGLSVVHEAFFGDRAEEIEEVQINHINDIRYIVGGEEERTNLRFENIEHLKLLVERLTRMASEKGTVEHLSEDHPFVRMTYNTARISIMGFPIAQGIGGATIHMALRKQRQDPFTSEFLLKKGSIDAYGDALLEALTVYGVSMAGYGGTGTGKTAMLRRYLTKIPDYKRIITIAENDEMCLLRVDEREYLTNEDDPTIPPGTKVPNPNYMKAINSVLMWQCTKLDTEIVNGLRGFDGLLNASLTFTPTVIVLQESKGGEIKAVIEEAISGHQVFTTIHANSPEAFFLRILLMYQQSGVNISDVNILKQVAKAFPVIIRFKRFDDGSRKIVEITELKGFDAATQDPITRTIHRYVVDGTDYSEEKYRRTGNGKIVVGHFEADPDFLSESLQTILRESLIPNDVLGRLQSLHSKCRKIVA